MARMSDVWDHTTQVLSGRGHALARIALLGVFLPLIVSAGVKAYLGGPAATPPTQILVAIVSIVIALVLIWARLALIALSTDPSIAPGEATAIATRRLGPAIGVVFVIGLVFVAVLIPPIAVALGGATNFSPELLQAGVMPTISPGAGAFVALYALVMFVLIIFVSARLSLVSAVVVNERLGLGAIRRSFQLTRGSTWRIIGVILLYGIVALVTTMAAQSVVGIVFALILGRVATVTFLAGIATAIVSAALTVVAATFVAQLYVALRGPTDIGIARTFE